MLGKNSSGKNTKGRVSMEMNELKTKVQKKNPSLLFEVISKKVSLKGSVFLQLIGEHGPYSYHGIDV